MKNENFRETFLIFGQFVFFVVIFTVDMLLPLGVAAGVPYIAPVLLTYYSRSYTSTIITAMIGSFLTVGGYLLSEKGGMLWMVLTNRAIALFAIGSTAALIVSYHKKRMVIQRNLHIIDQNVKVAEFSTEGVVTDISNDLCRYLGVSKSEIIATQPRLFMESLSEEALQKIWMILRSGKRWDGEFMYTSPAGEAKWAHSSIHPIYDSQYSIVAYNNFIADITDKKLLEEISVTDPLTSLPNRRFFDDTLSREIKIARREQWSLALAMIDIDFFKKYNDHYGHPEGDIALVSVANSLKQALKRPGDHVCRIGGEEFALFFSQAGLQESESFLEKICASVEALEIPHEKSDVSQFLTISVGVYVCSDGKAIPDREQMFKIADTALYAAKEKRNCVVLVN